MRNRRRMRVWLGVSAPGVSAPGVSAPGVSASGVSASGVSASGVSAWMLGHMLHLLVVSRCEPRSRSRGIYYRPGAREETDISSQRRTGARKSYIAQPSHRT